VVLPIKSHYGLILYPEDYKIEDRTHTVRANLVVARGYPVSDVSWEEKKASMVYYNQISEGYTQLHGGEQREKYQTALEALDGFHTDLVVDVGCGTGLFINMVTGKVGEIVGVDSSKEMVKKANCVKSENGHVVLCDADNLPFGETTFDTAVAFTLLQNVVDPSITIRQITSTLKPSSRAVLTALKTERSREAFVNLIEDAGLLVARILDEDRVNEYIAVCQMASLR
jgi:ubiquinone/menaquinone biosynthesis C-methylase UbiE